jgi:hypothetical protein
MIEGQQFVGHAPLFWQKRYLLNIERDLARAEKDWQLALDSSAAAVENIKQSGMRWPWALCLIEWAEIHLARGEKEDYENARELYIDAQALFREMESDFYVDQIDKWLRSIGAFQ